MIKKYYRQYVGVINDKNEQIVTVCLLNFSTRRAREKFEYWRDIPYMYAVDGFYAQNKWTFVINLTEKKIE